MDSPYNQIALLLSATAATGHRGLHAGGHPGRSLGTGLGPRPRTEETAAKIGVTNLLFVVGASEVLIPFTDAADHAARKIMTSLEEVEAP